MEKNLIFPKNYNQLSLSIYVLNILEKTIFDNYTYCAELLVSLNFLFARNMQQINTIVNFNGIFMYYALNVRFFNS